MEEVSAKERTFIVNQIVGGLLFAVFGAMGFFYSLWKENWNSAAWCFLLELACTLLMHFIKSYLRTELHLKYSKTFFRAIKYFSVVMSVCSWCAFATYIFLGATKKEEFNVQSHYAASPIAFIAGFWYLVLFFDCRKYQNLLE